MDKEDLTLECQECKQRFETLYIKNKYNGNNDDRELCGACYSDVHHEWFNDDVEFEYTNGKNEVYRARVVCQ